MLTLFCLARVPPPGSSGYLWPEGEGVEGREVTRIILRCCDRELTLDTTQPSHPLLPP